MLSFSSRVDQGISNDNLVTLQEINIAVRESTLLSICVQDKEE